MKDQPNNPSENKGQSHRGNQKRRFHKPRPPRNFWKSMAINKGLDLVVVIVGVTIAIYIHNLTTAAQHRSVEKEYVSGLIADLSKDIDELKRNLKGHKQDYESIVAYVEKYSKGQSIDDSLASVLSSILTLNTFSKSNSNTYTALINNHEINALSEVEVRGKIAEYYNQYHAIERFDHVYTELLFDINSYFSPYCDYTQRKLVDKSILAKVQTKNLLLLAAAQLEDGIENYENTLVMAESLKKYLEGL
jgi:hypothetical protein